MPATRPSPQAPLRGRGRLDATAGRTAGRGARPAARIAAAGPAPPILAPVLLLLIAACSALAGAPELVLEGRGNGPPLGREGWTSAIAVAGDPTGGWTLLEGAEQTVVRLAEDGSFVERTGGFGFSEGGTVGASDLAWVGFQLWLADPAGGRIVRYDRWLAALPPFTQVLERGSELPFERPASAVRTQGGDHAVLERDRPEVLLLDSEGRLVERVASFFETPLETPLRLEAGAGGVLALADAGRREVILLDRFGTLLGRRPWPLEGAGPTGMAFSGHLLLACGEGGLVLWRGGEELARWSAERFGGPVRDLAAQGGRVATVGDGGVFFFRLVLP